MKRIALLFLLLIAVPLFANEWLDGDWARGERKLDAELAKARASGDRVAESRVLAKRAHFAIDRSNYSRIDIAGAQRAIDEAIAAAQSTKDNEALFVAMHARARRIYWQKLNGEGEWSAVDAAVDEAMKVREDAELYFIRGLVRQMQEDFAPARVAFEKTISLANNDLVRSFGDRHLGYVLQVSGDMKRAGEHYTRSLELRRKARAFVLVPFAMNLVADYAIENDKDPAKARKILGESANVARRAKSWRAANAAETKLAELAENPKQAKKHRERALAAAEEYGDPKMIEEARKALQ